MTNKSPWNLLLETRRGGPSNSRNPTLEFEESNRRFKRELRKVECYNYHKHGHHARDYP